MSGSSDDQAHTNIQGNYFAGPTAIQASGLQINLSGDAQSLAAVAPDRWIEIGSLNPIELGVHRAAPDSNGDALTRYVSRDIDDAIDDALEEASSEGGFLLFVGDSAAGKTRTAIEAVKRSLGSFRLFSASSAIEISLFAQVVQSVSDPRVILWLDDLERFFEAGFNSGILNEIIRARAVVVATLRHDEYKRYRKKIGRRQKSPLDGSESWGTYNGARILDLVDPIIIERGWSKGEKERAKRDGDPRVAKALAHNPEAAVCEYLAAGPQLWRIYDYALREKKNHFGPSIVRAAIDLRRTGIRRDIPQDVLLAVSREYEGNQRVTDEIIPDWVLEKSFSWCKKIRFGVTGLLRESGSGWSPFDYLIDAAARDRIQSQIPEHVWHAALRFAQGGELFSVGWMLYLNEEYELASSVMRNLANAGFPLAMSNLGVLLQELGSPDEAEEWFKKSADLGHPAGQFNLGTIAYERDDYGTAESLWREAARSGEALAVQALAILYEKLGRDSAAEETWKSGAEKGDPLSAYRLGIHLHQRDRRMDAEIWWRQAAHAGHALSCLRLGNSLALRGKQTKASEWWTKAAESGIKGARGLELTELTDCGTGMSCIATNAEIREKLGRQFLEMVCSSVWPKGCQTCGKDLGELPPSLVIADCMVFGFAGLHHLQCRTPEWTENPGVDKSENISWTSRAFMLPLMADDEEIGTPCFLVNPALETAHLVPDGQGGWKVAPLDMFEKSGFGYLGSTFILDEPVTSGHRSLFDPFCVITDLDLSVYADIAHNWSAALDEETRDAIRLKGGVLVAVAAHIRPDLEMSYGALLQAMLQREVAVGWVPLSEDGNPLPRRGRRVTGDRFSAFQSGGEAIVGKIVGSAPSTLNSDDAKSWALDEIDIESDRLIPWEAASANSFFFTVDAISVKMYAVYLRSDSWIVSELLARHGGVDAHEAKDLSSWANQIIDVHLKVGPLRWRQVLLPPSGVGALAIESIPENSGP
ncbi:tetratricopeptide repeat protein [Streptomyces sp. NPDC088182]|uniref:tetratricopeptide repeat protein n=1 Tax=Streptomyces sp. NPDC088182 TaxID=3365838 RepID=UPI00381DE20B